MEQPPEVIVLKPLLLCPVHLIEIQGQIDGLLLSIFRKYSSFKMALKVCPIWYQ
jgi:hypothetical protein